MLVNCSPELKKTAWEMRTEAEDAAFKHLKDEGKNENITRELQIAHIAALEQYVEYVILQHVKEAKQSLYFKAITDQKTRREVQRMEITGKILSSEAERQRKEREARATQAVDTLLANKDLISREERMRIINALSERDETHA